MRNYLFLQGPLGPFFSKLAEYLRKVTGSDTYRIGFNGGDEVYAERHNYTPFKGVHSEFQQFVEAFIQQNKISDVVVYGDCRYYHKIAKKVCVKLNVRFWAFEEGYFRPNFVTFEKEGVNGHSRLTELELNSEHAICTDPEKVINQSVAKLFSQTPVKSNFAKIARYAVIYYWSKALFRKRYPHYLHHRPWLLVEEGYNWLVSGIRKVVYAKSQKPVMDQLIGPLSGKFFLAPLQVSIDSQILFHSPFDSVEEFIGVLVESFSKHAPQDCYLVFKHHPQDRGFNNYHNYIKKLAYAFDLSGRVLYCHDLHLPTLFKHARGTVTINSTAGISSLAHGTPTKALGSAVFNIDSITCQKDLSEFWLSPTKPNKQKFGLFKDIVMQRTQVNGSFYREPEKMFEQISSRLSDYTQAN